MTPEQLDLLIDDYLDGRLSAEQRDAFEQALLADVAAMDRLIAASAVHGLLQDRFAAQAQAGVHTLLDAVADESADPDGSSVMDLVVEQALAERRKHELEEEAGQLLAAQQAEQARENRYRRLRAKAADANDQPTIYKLAVVLAAAAALGLIAWLGWPDAQPTSRTSPAEYTHRQRDDGGSASRIAQAPTVAVIRSGLDARWTGLAIGRDGELPLGKTVTLKEGLAEIVFDDGATLIIQAPATFEPTGTNGLRLIAGKVTATIPDSAHGFTVATPAGLITDYGTEFGVHVNHDGQTLAQTYTGRIGLSPTGGGGEVDLVAGDAVIATPRGRVREVQPDALAFVRQEEFLVRQAAVADAGVDPYQRWLAYSYDLRRDEDVVLYYTFDAADVTGQTLRNSAGGRRSRQYDARFTAQHSAPDRFGGDTAFRFGGDGDYVEAALDREMDAVTLAGWYWINEMDSTFASLFHTDGTGNNGGIHWHINTNHGEGWAIEFVQNRRRSPQPGYWYDALSPGWQPSSLSGRWVHLALCYDTEAGEAAFYVDGREVVRSQIDDGVPVRLGEFRLGNWYARVDERRDDWPRALRGRIDEFVVIGRSLTGDEVAAMYVAGRPDN